MSLVPFLLGENVLLLFRHHPLASFFSLLSISLSTHTHTHTRNIYMQATVCTTLITLSLFNPRETLFFLSPSKMFLLLIPIHSTSYTYFPLSLSSFSTRVPVLACTHMCFYARSRAPVTLCATLCAPSEPHYPRVKVSLRPAASLQDEEEALPSLNGRRATPVGTER